MACRPRGARVLGHYGSGYTVEAARFHERRRKEVFSICGVVVIRDANDCTSAGRPPPSKEPPSGVSGSSPHHYPFSSPLLGEARLIPKRRRSGAGLDREQPVSSYGEPPAEEASARLPPLRHPVAPSRREDPLRRDRESNILPPKVYSPKCVEGVFCEVWGSEDTTMRERTLLKSVASPEAETLYCPSIVAPALFGLRSACG
jgi:hypothetical protein